MTNISDDRVKELREVVLYHGLPLEDERADLLAILDDYATLKAELAKQAPLIEAVEKLKQADIRGLLVYNCSTDGMTAAVDFLRASLKLKSQG